MPAATSAGGSAGAATGLECLVVEVPSRPNPPITLTRPTDGALLGDVLVLLAVIGLIYLVAKKLTQRPVVLTSVLLAFVFYVLVDQRWWNTAKVVVDEAGVSVTPHIGAETSLTWSRIHGARCGSGHLFPVFQDDATLVLDGLDEGGNKVEIAISRFLDRFSEIPAFVTTHLPRSRPTPREE